MENFWHKASRPMVTTCCGSFNHAQVVTENNTQSGTYCNSCHSFIPGVTGLRMAEVSDFIKNGIQMTEQKLKENFI